MKEYVNGSVAWDAFIPPHWEVYRLRQLFSFGRGISITKADLQDEGLPCVTYGDIHSRFGFELKPEVHAVRCVDTEYATSNPASMLRYGDFVFADTSEDEAGSGNFTYLNSEVPTIAGYHTVVARPRSSESSRFLAYVFDSVPFRAQISSNVNGIKVFSITQSILKNTRLPMPPLAEQERIVDYLDHRTAKIDSLLADLQSQAEMLDRYKRELIAEAVTKGLDKLVAMKDSGVDWIGEIPSHWDIVPLRAFLKVVSVKNNPDLPLLSVEREKGVVDRETEGSENNHNRIPDDLTNYKVVRAGQFVMNKMKAWRGSYGVSAYDGIVSPAYYVFDLNFSNQTFFNYAIRSTTYIGFFGRDSYGIRTDQWDFKISAIKDIPLAVPPVEEQKAIAEYLEGTIPRIEDLIADITAQIEKLKQYRQIVIHDAVTGKIKVTEG